jgi:hypothetical protein
MARGELTVAELPTGEPETVPVILANGAFDGPTAWVTAAVHGDEVTGTAAAQDLMDILDPVTLRGAVACLPVVNPAGLRRTDRTSYYHGDDPNRLFPDTSQEATRQPTLQALIARRLYETITSSADVVVDLHTAQAGSMPFVIRDRVLYGTHRTRSSARSLAETLDQLVRATDLPIVTEFRAMEYLEQNLHRSLAGAVLNDAGIPACTLELGSPRVVEEPHRVVGMAAVARVLVSFDLLDGLPKPIDTDALSIEAPISGQMRRHIGPRTPAAGIIRHEIEAGDSVSREDEIARIVAPNGEQLCTVESPCEGYVLARRTGITAYENDPLTTLAIGDDSPLVAQRE